jgi:hypothetical protein
MKLAVRLKSRKMSHRLRYESHTQSPGSTADVMDYRAIGQPDGDCFAVGCDDHIRTAAGNDAVVSSGADALFHRQETIQRQANGGDHSRCVSDSFNTNPPYLRRE